jgi:hypothetical protein
MVRARAHSWLVTLTLVGLSAATLGTAAPGSRTPVPPYAQGIVAGVDGRPVVVPVGVAAAHVAGTNVLVPGSDPLPRALPADPAAVAASRAWLAAGTVPGRGTRWEDMATRAMLDLDLLVLDDGATAAGWNRNWRYVWPRDAAYVAVAFTLTGRHEESLRVLQHLQRLQEDDGTWHARYLADGSGDVPDARGTQLDGLGWALWATWVWARTAPAADVPAGLESLRGMVAAAADAIGACTDPALRLPDPSPDYWELPEREVTLGTAAPLLVGARAGADLLRELGDGPRAEATAALARLLEDGVATHFGRRGFPRAVSGGGMDTAVAFLMPPFLPPSPQVRDGWRHALEVLARPVGGLAPGEGWRDDGVAWTPETAVFAMTAAADGDRETAERLLDWLDAHRTPLGSLPEKVNHLGQPAAVAPLAWTAATVVIALAVLDGESLPAPPSPWPPLAR